MTTLHVRIVGHTMPGRSVTTDRLYNGVEVGVQRAKEVIDCIPGDAPGASFDVEIDVSPARNGETDFKGPFAHGKLGDRFMYLSWGERLFGFHHGFRRAKLPFRTVPSELMAAALAEGRTLEAHLPMTDAKGGPICATVKPPVLEWRLA